MTDIRIPTREEIKARKARLWDRAHAAPKVDATKLYRLAFSSVHERIVPPSEKTNAILRRIADAYGVSIEEMKSSSRVKRVSQARRAAFYALAYERPELALAQIGRVLNKDHTTVLYAVSQYARVHNAPAIDRAHDKCNRKSPTPPSKAEAA